MVFIKQLHSRSRVSLHNEHSFTSSLHICNSLQRKQPVEGLLKEMAEREKGKNAIPIRVMKDWAIMVMIARFMLSAPSYYLLTEAAGTTSGDAETGKSLERTVKRLPMFVDELPRMPRIKGYNLSRDGAYIPRKLTIGMYMKFWKFHRDLPPSRVFAFGQSEEEATVPGPSIVAMSGTKTYIRWENHLPDSHIFPIDKTLEVARPGAGVPTVVHLHGGVSEPHSDGNARAWFTRRFRDRGETWKKATYVYHNAGATSSLWYHDHALGYTRLNLLAGLLGAYKVLNPRLESRFRLPKGKYDRQVVVMDRSFTESGAIYINSTGDNPGLHPEWQPEYFGKMIVVNGKAWPYMKVERRKYRFRIINASNARFFRFALDDGSSFSQIGSDSFYLEAPIHLKSGLLAPSEIMDIVIDFSKSKKKTVILTNDAPYPFPDGDSPGLADSKVLKFIVGDGNVTDRAHIPAKLETVKKLSEKHVAASRNVVLFEFDSVSGNPVRLLINFANFSAPVTELPKHGTTELWNIVNLTPDNHPFHIHLAAFQVLRQQKLKDVDELSACVVMNRGIGSCNLTSHADGDPVPPPLHEAGWKNVFKMQPFYATSILVHFAMVNSEPFPFDPTGKPGYAYHCHILDHEDNMMMRPYKLVD